MFVVLLTKGKTSVGAAVTSLEQISEPNIYIPSKMYDIRFCRERANEWTTTGKRKWNNQACQLVSKNNYYNMAWMGQRDPQTLQWNDYRCTLTYTYENNMVEKFSRSLITYAAASDSSFEHLNGYYCTAERYNFCPYCYYLLSLAS